MEKKSTLKRIFKALKKNKMLRRVVIGAVLIVAAIIAVSIFLNVNTTKEASVTNDYIISTLSKSSELTTVKLNYTGLSQYSDEGIPVLTKGDFMMVYKATMRAGIDLKEVIPNVNEADKIVTITIPKATIQDVKVDPSSIKYYDQSFTLFNWDQKEDANNAQALAEEAAMEEAQGMGVLELADEQAETLIKGLLNGVVPDDYEMKFIRE